MFKMDSYLFFLTILLAQLLLLCVPVVVQISNSSKDATGRVSHCRFKSSLDSKKTEILECFYYCLVQALCGNSK